MRHVADDAPYARLLAPEVVPCNSCRPIRRREKRCKHLDGSALAGAIGAKQAEDLTRLHIEREGIDSSEVAETTGETIQRNEWAHRQQWILSHAMRHPAHTGHGRGHIPYVMGCASRCVMAETPVGRANLQHFQAGCIPHAQRDPSGLRRRRHQQRMGMPVGGDPAPAQ